MMGPGGSGWTDDGSGFDGGAGPNGSYGNLNMGVPGGHAGNQGGGIVMMPQGAPQMMPGPVDGFDGRVRQRRGVQRRKRPPVTWVDPGTSGGSSTCSSRMDFPKETASESDKERTKRVDGVGRERTRVRFDERRATIFFGGSARPAS